MTDTQTDWEKEFLNRLMKASLPGLDDESIPKSIRQGAKKSFKRRNMPIIKALLHQRDEALVAALEKLFEGLEDNDKAIEKAIALVREGK